jgi:hypothetical protein
MVRVVAWNYMAGGEDSKIGQRYLHQAFIDKILNSNCHVITTVRRKTDYGLDKDGNGKTKVKLGTKNHKRWL